MGLAVAKHSKVKRPDSKHNELEQLTWRLGVAHHRFGRGRAQRGHKARLKTQLTGRISWVWLWLSAPRSQGQTQNTTINLET